jgi:multicomponent Na+:H+ antiporter subunit E
MFAYRARALARFAVHAGALASLWWLLTGGAAASWTIGVPVAIAGAAAGLVRVKRWRLRPLALLRFAGYFLRGSLQGGVDVARRVLAPGLPIEPELREWRSRLPHPAARVFFAEVVSLLPGTVAAELRGRRLILHVLDRRLPVGRDLDALERRIAELFALEIGDG